MLGLPPTATAEEIESAYQALIRAWNPANYPPDAPREDRELAEERTMLLIQARRELSDPARRRAYDELRRSARPTYSPASEPTATGSQELRTERAPATPASAAERRSPAKATTSALPRNGAAQEFAPRRGTAGRARLAAWLVLAGLMAVGAFAFEAVGSDEPPGTPPSPFWDGDQVRDYSFYRYSTAIEGAVTVALLLALVLLIMLRLPLRDTLALHAPRAWRWALGIGGAIVAGSFAFDYVYDLAFGPFDLDQGIPEFWDGSRAPQFLANLVVVAVLGPIFEEVMYRGVGFTLLERFGTGTAVVGTAVLFGLAHGYLLVLPVFIVFGLAVGWLRSRTGSLYPCILVHGVFNAGAVILTVTVG